MEQLKFAGGQYADALPDGKYAVQVPDGFVTHAGRVPFPASGGVLHHRVGLIDETFCIAGQGHQDGQAWLWNGGRWIALGKSYGTSVAAFGPLGVYVSTPIDTLNITIYNRIGVAVARITKPVGVRGIAAITGAGTGPDDVRPVDGWYGRGGLAEYQEVAGGVLIGQSAVDGLGVKHDAGEPSILEPGDVKFVRAGFGGGTFVAAAWKLVEKKAVIVWFTREDLPKLPRAGKPTKPVCGLAYPAGATGDCPQCDNPKSKHAVEPKKEPVVSTPNRLDRVREIATNDAVARELLARVKADTSEHGDREALGLFTRRVVILLHAEDPEWGALTKTSGEENWDGYAVDAIIYRKTQQVVDIVAFPDFHVHRWGAATPAWQEVPKRDTNHWAVPPAMPGKVTPKPDPKPDPTLAGRVEALERDLKAARETIQDVASAVGELSDAQIEDREAAEALKAALSELAAKAVERGAPVAVEGKISLREVARNEKVQWSGKVL